CLPSFTDALGQAELKKCDGGSLGDLVFCATSPTSSSPTQWLFLLPVFGFIALYRRRQAAS
ncbi:MAG: hypothetical protein KC561_20870, partial [Myxococcales bacterium]|nr:hypothetical protein [Myxococcales bacterium]